MKSVIVLITLILGAKAFAEPDKTIRCEFSCSQTRVEDLGPIAVRITTADRQWRDWCGNGSGIEYQDYLRRVCRNHYAYSELTFASECAAVAAANRCDRENDDSFNAQIFCTGTKDYVQRYYLMSASTSEGRVAAEEVCQRWYVNPSACDENCKISEVTCWSPPIQGVKP